MFYYAVLPAINFKEKHNGESLMKIVREISPELPVFVAEFWTGWFDHWGEEHNTWNPKGELCCSKTQFIKLLICTNIIINKCK